MSKLRVAIVGCGFVAQKRHIHSFLRLRKDVLLCAVCDLNQGLATEVAKKFGIKHVYSNLSEMLSKEDLDIVDICTPPNSHSIVAIEAMEKGCNVLMEKPMALSIQDCDKMIRASTKNGVKLSVVHNQRFYPPFTKARELVKRGAIGKLTGMRILSLTPRQEYMAHEDHWVHKLPGGVIGETGPHAVYMTLAFMNIKSVKVCARKILDYPWVLFADYRIELVGDSMSCSIYVSHACDYMKSQVDLFGTDGALEMELESMLLKHHRLRSTRATSVALSSLSTARQEVGGVLLNASKVIFRRPMLGHDIMIQEYVESILEDQPVLVTPEEGKETVRVMGLIVEKLSQKNQQQF